MYMKDAKLWEDAYYESIMWECQWDQICQTDIEVRGHMDSYSLATVLNPLDALYGGCLKTFALHDRLI